MRIVLEMTNGRKAGERVTCIDGQVFRIGKSAAAEFAVPHDEKLSRLHFSIECRGGCAIARDLQSTNGTLVNGAAIQQMVLNTGDEIAAGTTTFKVTLQDVPPSVALAGDQLARKRYRVRSVGSDRCLFHGEQANYDFHAVLDQLTALGPIHLAMNYKRAGLAHDSVGQRKDLLDIEQVPAEIRAQDSLVVMTHGDEADVVQLAGEVWGRDSAVLFVADLDEEKAVEKVQFLTGWFSRPSILRQQLDSTRESLNTKLLKDTLAIFCEGESDEEWRLYPATTKQEEWEQLGFASPPQELL